MAYGSKVLADSVSEHGHRLTTLEVTLPRILLAEFNTHRAFSRNSSSSRAIPLKEQIKRVMDDPFIPSHWGINQSGMQASEELDQDAQAIAIKVWLGARDDMVASARRLGGLETEQRLGRSIAKPFLWAAGLVGLYDYKSHIQKLNVHKQIASRLLEPFMWQTVIVTATEWDNFFALRDNPAAQPEFQIVARGMRLAREASTPRLLHEGEWHLPLLQPGEEEWARQNPELALKVCIGRCARVSYLTHDGKRDIAKDIELYERLLKEGHMSPFEHIARVMTVGELALSLFSANFRGWRQARLDIPNEDNFALKQTENS